MEGMIVPEGGWVDAVVSQLAATCAPFHLLIKFRGCSIITSAILLIDFCPYMI